MCFSFLSLCIVRCFYVDLNDLSGSIPTELALLTNVVGIYLWNNSLSGSIPSELGLLTNLRGIDFVGNNLSGSVPSELFALPNIQWIQVKDNPYLYALCDAYYDPWKIDIDCDPNRGVPSTAPSVSSSPSSSSPPTTSSPPTLSPTSSSAPTLTPDCSCDVGEFMFHLELGMDEWPWETSWRIEDENKDILVTNETAYNEQFGIFIHEYCLPVGCHNFVIEDSIGDGICCGVSGDGYYKGSIYGWKEVFDGGEFGDQAIEKFCGEDVCPFATHYPSTSPSASSRPSILPRQSIIYNTTNSTNDDDFDDDVGFGNETNSTNDDDF